MFTFPVGHFGSGDVGGGGGDYLDAVLDSVVFDLDVTLSNSYDTGINSQKWFNLIASPADGASQSDYDFFRGADGDASTDDPTFNGIIGDDAAYWSFDGGDLFSLASGINTAFLGNLHKTTGGSDFWIALAWHQTDDTWVAAHLFTTRGHTGNGQKGIEIGTTGTEKVQLIQRGIADVNIISDNSTHKQGDHIILVSHSHSTNESRLWFDEVLKTEASTFSIITTASALATIGAYTEGTSGMGAEMRLYSVAMGNEYLSEADAADIIAHLETRHNRDYTP